MKKLLSLLAVLLCTASFIFAIDAGSTLAANAGFSANTPTSIGMAPSFTFTGWIRQPMGTVGSFAAEADYRVTPDDAVIDLTLLKSTLNYGSVKVEAGRFSVADATGTIYSMPADGAYITYASRYFAANLYGAYTGLLNSRTISLQDTEGDYASSALPYDISGTPQYAIGMIRTSLPSLVKGQTFGVDGLACVNLDQKQANRMYATVFANGPVVRMLYYGLMCSASVIQDSPAGTPGSFGLMGKGNMVWYPGVLSSSLSGNLTYTTKSFSTFAAGGPSQDGSLPWSNVVDAQFGASCKPVSVALVSLTADIIAAGDNDSALSLHSFQWKLSGNIQVVSDFALTVSAGEIVPLSKSTSPYLNGSFGATLAF